MLYFIRSAVLLEIYVFDLVIVLHLAYGRNLMIWCLKLKKK